MRTTGASKGTAGQITGQPGADHQNGTNHPLPATMLVL